MICPKHLSIFNGLGKTHRVFVKNLFMWCSSNHCFLWFLIQPNIFTSSTVTAYWNPLLLTMFWVFVSINSHQFERAVWAFHIKRIFVIFISYFVYECVRCYRVDIWAVCAIPCNGYPFSLSIYAFVLIEPHCFRSTFWTFFSNLLRHPRISFENFQI